MIDGNIPIDYEILADGTCSYCGREAPLMELPDGSETVSDHCPCCDNYNNELILIERGYGQFTTRFLEENDQPV